MCLCVVALACVAACLLALVCFFLRFFVHLRACMIACKFGVVSMCGVGCCGLSFHFGVGSFYSLCPVVCLVACFCVSLCVRFNCVFRGCFVRLKPVCLPACVRLFVGLSVIDRALCRCVRPLALFVRRCFALRVDWFQAVLSSLDWHSAGSSSRVWPNLARLGMT